MAANGDLALAHRFQQRGLHLGRRTVDFIGQQHRMEDGAGNELEAAFLRAPDLGTGEVGGQQVGGELHAREIGLETAGQRTDGGGLGQSRGAFHQQVAIGEQCDQQAFHQVGLADDLTGQRGAQGLEIAVQARAGSNLGGVELGNRRDLSHRAWTSTGGFRFPIIAGARMAWDQDCMNEGVGRRVSLVWLRNWPGGEAGRGTRTSTSM